MLFSKTHRLERERRTIQVMIQLYCRGNHQSHGDLCPACQQLSVYAMQRLEKCPFQAAKPTCARCPIHCYKPAMRQQVRQVMRFAGPRMLLRHPLLAILHTLDGAISSRKPERQT
jgi:hypothetical protein